MRRNENAPTFDKATYEATVVGTAPLGFSVAKVVANDDDESDVMTYEISKDDMCMEYFYINPDSGAVSLKKLLDDVEVDIFKVNNPSQLF